MINRALGVLLLGVVAVQLITLTRLFAELTAGSPPYRLWSLVATGGALVAILVAGAGAVRHGRVGTVALCIGMGIVVAQSVAFLLLLR